MKKLILMLLLVVGSVMSANAETKTIYFDATKVSDGNERFALRVLTADDSEGDWINFTKILNNLYKATYDSQYTKIIICRMIGSTTENNWNNRWNQSYDLENVPDAAYFVADDYVSNTYYFNCNPWCVADDGSLTGNTWTTQKSFMAYDESTGLLNYSLLNKSFTTTYQGFDMKVVLGNWIEQYGNNGNNLWVKVDDGTYNVTITFSPTQKSDPSVALEKEITIGTSGFGTLTSVNCLNFNGTSISAYTAADLGNGSAFLTSVTNPADNTPMLLKAASGTYYVSVAATGTENPTDNAFKAGTGSTLATETVTGYNNYILNSGQFYLAAGNNVGRTKAYLQLRQTNLSRANLIFPEEGTTTGINSVSNMEPKGTMYFNLQGIKVDNPTKGLYIHNGKKIYVK